MWKASIVSSYLEMTALNLLLLCLQVFPKSAILVRDSSVLRALSDPFRCMPQTLFSFCSSAIGR